MSNVAALPSFILSDSCCISRLFMASSVMSGSWYPGWKIIVMSIHKLSCLCKQHHADSCVCLLTLHIRPKHRHYSLATYILLRGITLLIRTGNKPRVQQRHPWLHAALAPTRFKHGDTALMCAACSQIIYAFIMMPQTLPVSYVRFIRKQGAKELYVWQGIRVSSTGPHPAPGGWEQLLPETGSERV